MSYGSGFANPYFRIKDPDPKGQLITDPRIWNTGVNFLMCGRYTPSNGKERRGTYEVPEPRPASYQVFQVRVEHAASQKRQISPEA